MWHNSPYWGDSGALITETPTNPFNTDVSTVDTLRIMAALAVRDSQLPIMRQLASDLCNDCSSLRECAQSIWYFVHGFLKFRPHEDMAHAVLGAPRDGIDRQVLISPASLLGIPSPEGDCAVYASLTSALLKALGMKCAYRVTASDKEEPWRWSHVYVMTEVELSNLMALDTSHGDYPGWETKTKFREFDYWI